MDKLVDEKFGWMDEHKKASVSDLMSKWRPTMSGIPQSSLLGVTLISCLVTWGLELCETSASLPMTPGCAV